MSMTKTQLQREVLQLPMDERLDLAEAIWDSFEIAAEQPPIPEWQQRLLDDRIAADEADPEAGSPWEEVKQRILSSL